MSRYLTIPFALALLAGTLALAGTRAAVAESRCYGEWSEAAPIVAREQLKSAVDVQALARQEFGGEVVRIVLCQEASQFVYRLVLRRLDGHIGKLTVSATRSRTP